LLPIARHIWDLLLEDNQEVEHIETESRPNNANAFRRLRLEAERQGEDPWRKDVTHSKFGEKPSTASVCLKFGIEVASRDLCQPLAEKFESLISLIRMGALSEWRPIPVVLHPPDGTP
jgi:hypothetical protein